MFNLDPYRKNSKAIAKKIQSVYDDCLDHGDGRKVYGFTPETILKVARGRGRWTLEQNKLEIEKSPLLDDRFITKVLDASDDGYWLLAERGVYEEKVTDDLMHKHLGKNLGKLNLSIMYAIAQRPLPMLYAENDFNYYKKHCKKSEWFQEFVRVFTKAGYEYPDLGFNNFMTKNGELVMVDYGVNYTLKEATNLIFS
jgi:hypothetical protein